MKKYVFFASIIVLVVAGFVFSDGSRRIREFLTGFEEVPSVSTDAEGRFNARISHDGSQITYELRYSDLQGAVTQAHIHFGQTSVNGAIIVWLCANNPPITNAPPGTQTCPASPATITGTIDAGDVTGQPTPTPPGTNLGQGIQPGEFDELLRAIRAGKTYVNVHTTTFPGGEVRSQIEVDRFGRGHDDH
jgi:hypothetical protein